MRGARAKRLRKIAAMHEPKKNKHGLIQYYLNEVNNLIMCGGHRGVYQVFKRTYKNLKREDYEHDQNAIQKLT